MLSPSSSQQKEKEKKTKIVFYLFRLLDICHGQRREREMSLYLVFEHVHQDLASYLEKCPPPGLPQDRIKVNTSPYKNAIVCVLKSSFNYFFLVLILRKSPIVLKKWISYIPNCTWGGSERLFSTSRTN